MDNSKDFFGSIMIVDDNPSNLKLLEDMLLEYGYDVRSFPRGRLALIAADQDPPDLFLLDINMPEMNGYEVCERLKSSARLSGIPVIFLSALNAIEDKVKGFQSGGVDYISKPFQFEEVQARVQTHVKLRHAQQAEKDLLEKTLGGAVGTIWELIQLSSPMLGLRSRAIRDIVLCILNRMQPKDPWQYELAATLCLIGCIVLPDEIFERAYCGQHLTRDEERMYQAHPERAASLLSNIPRLEVVAEIIRRHQSYDAVPPVPETAGWGAHMLRLAVELDRRVFRGLDCASALSELKSSGRFDARMLEALKTYALKQIQLELRRLRIRELRVGMVLEQDILDGNLTILKAGTSLNETWIERLKNFGRTRAMPEFVDVRIPKIDLARPSEGLDYRAPGAGNQKI